MPAPGPLHWLGLLPPIPSGHLDLRLVVTSERVCLATTSLPSSPFLSLSRPPSCFKSHHPLEATTGLPSRPLLPQPRRTAGLCVSWCQGHHRYSGNGHLVTVGMTEEMAVLEHRGTPGMKGARKPLSPGGRGGGRGRGRGGCFLPGWLEV